MTLLLLLLLGCPKGREVPEHLRLDPDTEERELAVLDSPEDLVRFLVDGDPLARSQPSVPVDALGEVGAPLRAYVEAARSPEALRALEAEWRGTAVVALSRGLRLGAVERRLADADEQAVLELITPLAPLQGEPLLDRSALAWTGEEGSLRERVVAVADPWVLSGWLDGPEVPLAPVAEALRAPQFDALRESPLGALVVARAEGAQGPADEGLADLERATRLALEHAMADRDRQQAAWKETKAAAAAELGTDDPVAFLLLRARDRLTAAASDDRAAGGALLAIHATRWVGACEHPPCRGLDRVDGMLAAGRWGHGGLARTWEVLALKEALDAVRVTEGRAGFAGALVDLADALSADADVSSSLVRRREASPAVWLALSRAAGGEDATSRDPALLALEGRIAEKAARAAALVADPATRSLLDRLARQP